MTHRNDINSNASADMHTGTRAKTPILGPPSGHTQKDQSLAAVANTANTAVSALYVISMKTHSLRSESAP